MAWQARSFLCVSLDAMLTRLVQAIAGFGWGFTITGADIAIAPPAILGPGAWDGHLDLPAPHCPAQMTESSWLAHNGSFCAPQLMSHRGGLPAHSGGYRTSVLSPSVAMRDRDSRHRQTVMPRLRRLR